MAPVSDQFRRSDLRLWGSIAGASCAVALVSAVLPAILPSQFFASLHATRLSMPISGIADVQARLEDLSARADSTEASTASVRAKVGMLEAQLPKMLATLPAAGAIDTSSLTGAINPVQHGFSSSSTPMTATSFVPVAAQPIPSPLAPAPGGTARPAPRPAPPSTPPRTPPATRETAAAPPAAPSSTAAAADDGAANAASWTQVLASADHSAKPDTLVASIAPVASASEEPTQAARRVDPVVPLPRPTLSPPARAEQPSAKANAQEIGIAVGAPVQPGNALTAWQDLAAKVGVMLVGTAPLLADDPGGSGGKVLVAGPIPGIAKAAALCAQVEGAGITCTPMPYVGTDLPPAANP